MSTSLRARVRNAFAHPRAPAFSLVAAALLAATTLPLGHLVDDRWHQVLLGADPAMSRMHVAGWDLFRFFDGDAARTGWMIEQGYSPWWTDPGVVLSFLRPLSAMTHVLDHALGGAAVVAHAQSAAWYVALVAAAVFAYRRLLGSGPAFGLAAWMYAVDFSHGMPAGWVANRNALVSGVFGLLSLGFHADSSGRPLHAAAALACLAASLLGGESGFGAVAYLFAFTLLLDARPWRRRVASLAPLVVLAVGWFVTHRALGYGARHSGVYVDPLEAPWLALQHVPRNAGLLIAACFGAPGPDPYMLLPAGARVPFVVVSFAVVALVLYALVPVLKRDARARFLLVGGALSVLPGSLMILGSMRLLTLPSFGLLGVLAIAMAAWLDKPAGFVRASALGWNAVGHVLLAPLMFVATSRSMVVFDLLLSRLADATRVAPDVERLVFMNAPEPTFIAHIRLLPTGRRAPDRLLAVGNGLRSMTVRRDDDRSITVAHDGSFVGPGTDGLTRLRPMRVGERVQLGGVVVDVREVDARGMPTVARFSFAVSLDDRRLGFVAWDGQRVSRFALPAVGDSVTLAATPLGM